MGSAEGWCGKRGGQSVGPDAIIAYLRELREGSLVHSSQRPLRSKSQRPSRTQQRHEVLDEESGFTGDEFELVEDTFGVQRRFPLILTLDTNGIPHRWINWQHAVWYYAKNQVAWETGSEAFTVTGGRCRDTGEVSRITAASIIAIKGKAMAIRGFNQVPPLNNRELFHRDRHVCGYCGGAFSHMRLTRDHIVPYSRGGVDTWMNVVTACRGCNERKGSRLPEEARMELLYAPYVPNRAEFLILANRRILADQMNFLKQHVSANSRVHLS
jgi:HNH endonuclease